ARHRKSGAAVGADLDHRNAAFSVVELDDFFLAIGVAVNVDVVVLHAALVEVTQRSPRISAPVSAVNSNLIRHEKVSSAFTLRKRCRNSRDCFLLLQRCRWLRQRVVACWSSRMIYRSAVW